MTRGKVTVLEIPSDAEKPPVTDAVFSDNYQSTEATTAIRERTISCAVRRLDICDDSYGAMALVQNERVRNAVRDASKIRNIHVRFITEVVPENLAACKELAKFVELRHVGGVKGNFVVTDKEYYSFAPLSESTLPEQAIHSTQPALVEHEQYVFQTLWGRALPSEERIKEIEQGIQVPRIEVTQDTAEIQSYFLDLVKSARSEILLLIPTVEAFEREESTGVIDALNDRVAMGVRFRIVSPVNEQISKRIKQIAMSSQENIGYRFGKVESKVIETPIAENTVTILVIDRKFSFIIEQKDNNQKLFSKAVGLATYSTSKPSVSSHILFFETLWREDELRRNEALAKEMESKARRQSELLQDILTHDIRNYNQVIKLSSELLEEQFSGDENARGILENMLDAVNGSTQLLERAKKLGKILSDNKTFLYPVNITEVIHNSISTVRNAYPEKRIDFRFENRIPNAEPDLSKRIEVIADDLLDEVFVNAFANSIKYTEGDRVQIETCVEPVYNGTASDHDRPARPSYIKVSIADHGRGIPDEAKPALFSRYLKTAKGTGLGLSIIHALVVERYRGEIVIEDRVPNDYEKGAKLEAKLPYHDPKV